MRKMLIATVAALLVAGSATAGADECFTRTYDRAHLARHPDQMVTSVSLRLRRSPRWFMVQFTLRDRDKPFESVGICRPDGHCYVEGDGGGLDYERTASGLMMRLDRIRVAEYGKDIIDATSPEITSGTDDRVFRLDRVTCENDPQGMQN